MTIDKLMTVLERNNIECVSIANDKHKIYTSFNVALEDHGKKEVKSYKLKPIVRYELAIEVEGELENDNNSNCISNS